MLEEQMQALSEQLSYEQMQSGTDKSETKDLINSLKSKVSELEKERKVLRAEMDTDRTLNEEKFKFLTEQKQKALTEQQRDARKFQEDLDRQLQIRNQLKKEQKKLSDENIHLLAQKQQLLKSYEETKQTANDATVKCKILTDKMQE